MYSITYYFCWLLHLRSRRYGIIRALRSGGYFRSPSDLDTKSQQHAFCLHAYWSLSDEATASAGASQTPLRRKRVPNVRALQNGGRSQNTPMCRWQVISVTMTATRMRFGDEHIERGHASRRRDMQAAAMQMQILRDQRHADPGLATGALVKALKHVRGIVIGDSPTWKHHKTATVGNSAFWQSSDNDCRVLTRALHFDRSRPVNEKTENAISPTVPSEDRIE